MKQKTTKYLDSQLAHSQIYAQYIDGHDSDTQTYSDPLNEDAHEVVKGLIHKYDNRALIKVSYQCAAHCRFCTRIRQIGTKKGNLSDENISRIIQYLSDHPEIDDVILSGGDPFYTPQITIKLLQQIRLLPSVKTLRIGSRLALQSPQSFNTPSLQSLLEVIDDVGKQLPFFILLHINTPQELTTEARAAIALLRGLRVTVVSQTVFLKGINDSFEIMYELFRSIYQTGVLPYYLYHCDAVAGQERFVGNLEKEIAIVKRLYQNLSGLACPKFVIDIENGYGKIPVPLGFIDLAENTVNDFKGNERPLL